MIIARAPVRISLGGGGTDLPSYYRVYGGELVAASIRLYQYVAIQKICEQEYRVIGRSNEHVSQLEHLSNPLIQETLRLRGVPPGIELVTFGDVSGGTGLGSSGAFGVALLKALDCLQSREYRDEQAERDSLASEACQIEIERCGFPTGKQDQYAASFGGVSQYIFHKDDSVEVVPLEVSRETLLALEQRLLLFFTGYSRTAHEALKVQLQKTAAWDQEMIANLHKTRELGIAGCAALKKGAFREYAEIMDTHWENKRKRSLGITNNEIDNAYRIAKAHGALGGKLVGGGGGGFLLLYTEKPEAVRSAMAELGLQERAYRFDFEGVQIVSR